MSFRFLCPVCRTERFVNDVLKGRRVRCPECGELVTASPSESEPSESERSETESAQSEPAQGDPGQSESLESEPSGPGWPPAESPAGPAPPSSPDAAAPVVAPSDLEERAVEYEAISFRDREREDQTQMDMTPMVDVTFLLLIFFMVTAAFGLQKSKEVPNPNPDQASTQAEPLDLEENPDYVTVLVDQYNTYRVMTVDWDEEAPSEQELLIKLRLARQGGSEGKIPTKLLVEASGEALHGKVVAALDAGSAVGMEQVQLMMLEDG